MRPRHKKDVTILKTTVFYRAIKGVYLGYANSIDGQRHCIAFEKEIERGKNFYNLSHITNKDYILKYWPEFIDTHRFFFLEEEQFNHENELFRFNNEKPLRELLWDMEGETLQ